MEQKPEIDQNQRLFNALVRFFFILGFIDLAAGMLHLGALISGITEAPVEDALFNTFVGVSYLICGLVMRNRNPAVMILFAVQIVAMAVYAPITGRPPGYFILIICAVIYYYLFKFWRSGEFDKDPGVHKSE